MKRCFLMPAILLLVVLTGVCLAAAPPADRAATKPATQPKADDLSAIAEPDVGTEVTNIKLETGLRHVSDIQAFSGRVIVIEFGSLSSPTFRDHVAEMEKLKKDSDKRVVWFSIIYTREANPSDEPQIERNKTDKIEVAQPTDMETRRGIAEGAAKQLGITIPLTIDDMDDSLVKKLGGYPNGCIVIGRDGKIAARQKWIEPGALKPIIDEAVKKN